MANFANIGDTIVANGMEMRVTGEDANQYIGVVIYKGKERGEAFLAKSMFTNPHYCKGIQVIPAQ